MVEIRYSGDALWDRIERAVEKVKDRLRRVVRALNGAGIPYAVVGGNAVQVWVAQVDEGAVRNTKDVDIALHRRDLERAKMALEDAGFHYRNVQDVDTFLDGPDASPRDAVHIVFAGERVRPNDLEPVPEVDDAKCVNGVRTMTVQGLTNLFLSSYRTYDRVNVSDLIAVGLVDHTWLDRVPASLRDRLQTLLDDPEG